MGKSKVSNAEISDLRRKGWSLINELRDQLSVDELYVVLYLITLYKEKADLNSFLKSRQLKIATSSVGSLGSNHMTEQSKTLAPLHSVFNPVIQKLNSNGADRILDILTSIDIDALCKHFAFVFDDLLYTIFGFKGRIGGDFVQPKELSRFVCELTQTQESSTIYNPFAGLASFAIHMDNDKEYVGQESDPLTWAVGTLRLRAYGKGSSFKLVKSDSYKNWNPESKKYDLIVAQPPFGARLPQNLKGNFGIVRSYDQFLLERGIEDLGARGKLIAVVPNGILYRSGSEQNLRRSLIEGDLLEMVISFPGGLFKHTAIHFAILVVNKSKKKKDQVHFVDAKRFVEHVPLLGKQLNDSEFLAVIKSGEDSNSFKTVSNNKIREFEFDLSAQRYFQKQVDGVALGDLVTVLKGRSDMAMLQGKYIRVRDLKDDRLDYELNLVDIRKDEIPLLSQTISETCLLVSTGGQMLKPTFFRYVDEPIYLTSHVLALKVDKAKVDLDYLIHELYADYVVGQLESFLVGTTLPMIRKEDLLRIKIHLPSLDEQRAKVKGAVLALVEQRKKSSTYDEKIQGLREEIVAQNTYLRHALSGPVSNLRGSIEDVNQIVENQLSKQIPNILQLKVSEKHTLTFGEYLQILDRDIARVSNEIRTRLLDTSAIYSKKIEPCDIHYVINNYVKEQRSIWDFEIAYSYDKDSFVDLDGNEDMPIMVANVDLLHDLFSNLLKNAIEHGFRNQENRRIEIYMSKDSEDSSVYILFSNTGNSFPEDFTVDDFIRKGGKKGESAGDGYGGWYINEITKYFSGKLDIIDERGGEGVHTDLATSFEMTFPILYHEK